MKRSSRQRFHQHLDIASVRPKTIRESGRHTSNQGGGHFHGASTPIDPWLYQRAGSLTVGGDGADHGGCYRGLVIGIRPYAVPVAAPARHVPLAGRGARIIPPRFVTANFLDTREEAEQFDPNKRDGRLCLGDLSECGHIAVIRNPRCMSWQSRKPRELLISSRLPLPARITITKTWGG